MDRILHSHPQKRWQELFPSVQVPPGWAWDHKPMNTLHVDDRLKTLNRIRRLSRLMDTAFHIPVINYKVGLDPIIGLIPGAGDVVSTAFSGYLIFLATRFNLPGHVLSKMIFNVALESVAGSVPLVGDFFDATYKANIRNLALLEQHLEQLGMVPEQDVSQPSRIV